MDQKFFPKTNYGTYLFVINMIFILFFSVIYYRLKNDNHFTGLDSSSSFLDCFYFSFTTMSTVGYGDISPNSATSKIIVMFQQLIVLLEISSLVINK